MALGFDNNKYKQLQSDKINQRIAEFGKLYLEFGGKLFDDNHASRVLPGFMPDSKLQMLLELKDKAEIIIAINSADIEKNKIRGDLGITYDLDVFRLIDVFRSIGLYVGSVVLTRYSEQDKTLRFEQKLRAYGIKVYHHYEIAGYPHDVAHIVSEKGYGANDYVETERELVVVTAPGPGSGKMAVCLSQLYHHHARGAKAGYAKFETFPIWNLPLRHPLQMAYEAATADLDDVNMIDPYHLEAYSVQAVNYNRDTEVFPVLRNIFTHIYGSCPYQSPTDMGVNMVGFCITDEEVVKKAAHAEIIRRYYQAKVDYKLGLAPAYLVERLELIMTQCDISPTDRPVVAPALEVEEANHSPAVAIALPNGEIATGRTGNRMGACAGAIMNALKRLAGIPDHVDLIAPIVFEPMQSLKVHNLGSNNPRLHPSEVLMALAICATTNPMAALALSKLDQLRGQDIHSTVIISSADEKTLRRLGLRLTCEAKYETECLYHL